MGALLINLLSFLCSVKFFTLAMSFFLRNALHEACYVMLTAACNVKVLQSQFAR